MRERTSTRRRVICFSLTLTAALLGLGGCYERVVRDDGLGSGVREVYEPNLKSEADDPDPWNRKSSSDPGIKRWKNSSPPPKPKPIDG